MLDVIHMSATMLELCHAQVNYHAGIMSCTCQLLRWNYANYMAATILE